MSIHTYEEVIFFSPINSFKSKHQIVHPEILVNLHQKLTLSDFSSVPSSITSHCSGGKIIPKKKKANK
jgi:hypothetical protein